MNNAERIAPNTPVIVSRGPHARTGQRFGTIVTDNSWIGLTTYGVRLDDDPAAPIVEVPAGRVTVEKVGS